MIKQLTQKYIYLFLLTVFILTGTILRIYKLDQESLWFDELSTWETSRYDIRLTKYPLNNYTFDKTIVQPQPRTLTQKIQNIIENTRTDRIHLPLYYICIFFVKSAFGDSEYSLRALSVVPGILSIIMLYLLAALFFSRQTALFSSAFISILWFPVYYSREARMYMLILFFCILSTYLAVRFYYSVKNNKLAIRFLIFYFFASIFNAYLHFCSFYFTTLQAFTFLLFLMIHYRKSHKHLLLLLFYSIIQLCAVLPLFFYIFSLLPGVSGIPNVQWATKPGIKDFFLFYESFFSFPANKLLLMFPPLFKKSKLVFYAVNLVCLVFFFLKYDNYVKNKVTLRMVFSNLIQHKKNELFFIGWLFLPTIFLFFISVFIAPMYTDRFLIFALPPLYILLAQMISNLTKNKKLNLTVFILLIGIAGYDLLVSKNYYHNVNKMQYKEAIQYITDNQYKYKDFFIASNLGSFGLEYYLRKSSLEHIPCLILQESYTEDFSVSGYNDYSPAARQEIDTFIKFVQSQEYKYMWYLNIWDLPEEFRVYKMRNILTIKYYRITLSLYEF